jgi:ABC-type dipeptide/oligopeptide/nickel transport system permease component
MPFLLRLALAPVVFVVVAALTYAMPRILLPELFPGEEPLEGTWRAAGHAQPLADSVPDFQLLCALTLWGAVLLIIIGLIADGIVSHIDPRVRMSSAQAW